MIDHLNGLFSAATVFRPVESVKIAGFRDDHRFIEGDPAMYVISKQRKGGPGIFYIEINHMPAGPAAVAFQQFFRQVKVMQIEDQLNAVFLRCLNYIPVECGTFRIRLSGLQIPDQPCPLNGRAVGIESELLH